MKRANLELKYKASLYVIYFFVSFVHQIMQSVHVWFLLKELVLLGINMVQEYFILNKFKNFGGDNIGR
mgnify:CR=1 FL=1